MQPRILVCVDHAWYIVTNDPDREGEQRTFALYRMRDAEDTGVRFKPQGHIDLDEVLRHSLGIDTRGERARVQLRFKKESADLAQEETWHDTEVFEPQPDGRLLLTMDVALNPELERRIHRHGPNVEVLAPPVLRKKFIEYAREQQAMYLA